jgi:hypothetical protein
VSITRDSRTALPADLSWLDHHGGGPVALLVITRDNPQFPWVDYFNRSVTQAYVPRGITSTQSLFGAACNWAVQETGVVRLDPGCGPVPHRFFLQDQVARPTFYDERFTVSDPRVGRVVAVDSRRPPRLRSIVATSCPRFVVSGLSFPCNPAFTVQLWLDDPGIVELRFRGGTDDHAVTFHAQGVQLPAAQDVTFRFPVAAGASTSTLPTDWAESRGSPTLMAADLLSARHRTHLLR